MIFRRKQEMYSTKFGVLSAGEKNEALELIASDPVRKYLFALMDELIRQGLYLDDKKREGARLTIELLAEQIKKGEAIIYKKRKRAGNISES